MVGATGIRLSALIRIFDDVFYARAPIAGDPPQSA
jgi:hypothetical protein